MDQLLRPPALRAGDTVAIVPTARAVNRDELMDGITLAEGWGLKVRLGAGVGRKRFQQAGTIKERSADLQAAFDDPEVKAVWCARGGYGTVRLLEHIDLSKLKHSPKWVVGFSDITVLHNALHDLRMCSLHAQMPFMVGAKTPECRESLRAALFGEEYVVSSWPNLSRAARVADPALHATNRPGECEGLLVGGNLSLLYALRGTPYDIDPAGKILFLEDLDELLYHVDRMVMNLKLGGWFKDLAGLVIGGMTDMHDKDPADPFGMTAEEIIADAIKGTNYPVCYDFPAGHIADNRPLMLGRKAKLSVTPEGATLSFKEEVPG